MGAPAELCHCSAIRQAGRQIDRHYERAFAPFGLTIDQFGTLAKLHRLGPTSIPGLTELMAMDRAMLHYTLKGLLARDLVAVTRAAGDGRCRIVSITATGTPLLLAAMARWQALNAQVDAALGDGGHALRQLLKQIETLSPETLSLETASPEPQPSLA